MGADITNFCTWLFRSHSQDAGAPKSESLAEHLEKHCRAKNKCPLVEKAAKAAEYEDETKIDSFQSKADDGHAALCADNPEYKAVYDRYHGIKTWHKAPNGKPSNLTEQQWVIVRTPSFKKWFGEWEDDAENSSKVVDENGEPMVVYHGNLYGDKFTRFSTKHQWSGAPAGSFWFTDDIDVAKGYMRYANDKTPMAVFLNIKTPLDYDAKGNGFKGSGINEIVQNEIECGETDGAIIRNIIDTLNDPESEKTASDIVAFKPSQIKSADPVTYNDDGEIIPGAKRFDKGSDIRGKVSK